MKLKSVEYYTQKREEAQARIEQIERLLSSTNHEIRWKYDGDRLRAERSALDNDIKGYKCIISHLETGIDISRYQNKEHAKRIIKRERPMGRRVDNE